MLYYNKDDVGSSSCWFSSSKMLELKSACLQFYLSPHADKIAAEVSRIMSCIPVKKHGTAQCISLFREENTPCFHLIN